MDKLSMQSVDGVAANIDIIARHFPSCITEARDPDGQLVRGIDFEKLKAELSSSCIPEKAERYQFTWPGKMDAARLANQPSAATLRPCREESVDFDTTSNLYIEGDNLEVLKVLRNTYAGKVKMIYIDPPYNTGNDFIYEDDFAIDRDDFLVQSGQIGADGERLVVNSDTNGRFHTDWLNMIYPRLKLARELLSEDGAIFISIDDHELESLLQICSELFGESNHVATLIWVNGGTSASYFTHSHEYVLVFAKSIKHMELFAYVGGDRLISDRAIKKVSPKNPATDITFPEGLDFESEDKVFPNVIGTSEKVEVVKGVFQCADRKLASSVTLRAGWAMKDMICSWLNGKEVVDSKGQKVTRFYFKSNGILQYEKEKSAVHPSTVINGISTKSGTIELENLISSTGFSYPKSTDLIKYLSLMLMNDEICMDFFSGSSTTAHAVMRMNAEDGGNRRFIMVQIPEPVAAKSEAFNAGYKNICEIGKERIRRAGAAVKAESGLMSGDLDTGFRVLKLDSSNMKDVYYSADEVSLGGFSEFNIKDDRSGEDLLFQVMLDLGIELSSSIEVKNLAGHTVYVVNDGYLAACFDDRVSLDAARTIAGFKPYWFVMCDAAFGSDADADNIMQVFSGLSEATQIKVI